MEWLIFDQMEMKKQAAWNTARPALYHFRTSDGYEVDMVLEKRSGAVVGVEVKAAATVGPRDFKGLRHKVRDSPLSFGPMHNVDQVFQWTEPVPCGCSDR